MRRFALVLGAVLFILAISVQSRVLWAYDGACGKPCCEQCMVMKTVQETVYDYQEITAYKIEYKEVTKKVPVKAVVYKPAPRTACVPDTVLMPPTLPACSPAACVPSGEQCLVPTNICRKVELEGLRAEETTKDEPLTEIQAVQVPYKVTICLPHIVCKEVPVTLCCPETCKCHCHNHCAATEGVATPSCESGCGK